MPDQIELQDPPVGRIVFKKKDSTSCLVWEPGNGMTYFLLVTPVSVEIERMLGGRVLISLSRYNRSTYVTYAGNPGGLYHLSFVEEKWGEEIGEESTYYFTALLNWTLFKGNEVAMRYAMEIFEEAKKKWKW